MNATETVLNGMIKLLFGNEEFKEDLRTKNWFLADSILPTLVLVNLYLFVCLYVGPRYMKDRKPFKLKNTLMIYNGMQIVLSAVMAYEFYKSGWNGHYSFACQPIGNGTDPLSMRMARAVWLNYISRLTEFLDTVFFVLRKKDNQISLLHVYHHACMPINVIFVVKYFPGGHGTLYALINAFVHVIMYAYYFLAGMGPKIQKYLWWKKYITILQIVQFVIVLVQNIVALFQPNCSFPKSVVFWQGFYSIVFICLFSFFYVSSYRRDKSRAHKME